MITSWFEHLEKLSLFSIILNHILVTFLFIIISLVFFYVIQVLFLGFSQPRKQSIGSRGHTFFNPTFFCLVFLTFYCLIA